MLSAGDTADDHGDDGRGGRGGPPGPAQLQEAEDRVQPAPEHRPRGGAHEAAHDRLAGIERVATALLVEDPLQQDRGGRHPQQGRGELGGDSRTDQPLAAADRQAEHDCARTGNAQPVAEAVWRGGGHVGNAPSREPASFDEGVLGGAGRRLPQDRFLRHVALPIGFASRTTLSTKPFMLPISAL